MSSTPPLDEFRKILSDFTSTFTRPHYPLSDESAKILLDKVNEILEKISQDLQKFVELDIKTQIKNGSTEVAVYETKYEINGNITEIFPEKIDSVMFARHNDLSDNVKKQRDEVVLNIIKIIAGIAKFPLPG